MRVLLVNPPPHHSVDQYDRPDFPRLSLAVLAGELRAKGIGPVAIVDAKFERLSHEDVLGRIARFRPDVVGLTAMTTEILSAARLAGLVKQLSAPIVTVIGGAHVSALPEQTLAEFPAIDFGVIGDGEVTFIELIETLGRSDEVASVAGLVVRRDGQAQRTTERDREPDLDRFASPAWDLLPPARRYLVSTQRGCPFHCDFCANPNGRIVRQRSIPRVVEEMRELAGRFGARALYICDEIFTFDRERTIKLLDAMIAAGLPRTLVWSAPTHARFVDREVMTRMKMAGCNLVEIGVETGDPRIMARLDKGLSFDRVRQARRDAASVGLPFEALMILGHPGETWESAQRTIDLAVELNADQTVFGIMVPYPGTRIAQEAERGTGGLRLIASNWNDYGKQIGHALELEHLTRDQLERLQLLGYAKVLLGNRRYVDAARFAWSFRREGAAVVEKVAATWLSRRSGLRAGRLN